MERYICVHGHFYQPPRENPWLDSIERQVSAAPYHDWNERINAECYAANAHARLLDSQGKIAQIVNNYEKMSFNFGPTLLRWMQEHKHADYRAIVQADRRSAQWFGGHGSAMAQAYNHIIMPLANRRDKWTQVAWGIEDFRHRFGRDPEGMWLPETAVDVETLEILAQQGIRFTVLAPRQAKRIRAPGQSAWGPLLDGAVETKRPYLARLPSGRTIALFFYHGFISQAVAFERLLHRGEDFAHRLCGAFVESFAGPQLVHIATDGETYGHHHRYGEMALAYALRYIEQQKLAKLMNYGAFLARFPPRYEVEIVEDSAWSCAHGVGRWERDCGCRGGRGEDWHQRWRAPLREALDGLRDALATAFSREAGELLREPWEARDAYISVLLDRSAQNLAAFWSRHARRTLTKQEQRRALCWLESQHAAMLMYTSCGWFFDEISDLETVQILQYAARAHGLVRESVGPAAMEAFVARLEQAPSNRVSFKNGAGVVAQKVVPAQREVSSIARLAILQVLLRKQEEPFSLHGVDFSFLELQRLAVGGLHCFVGVLRAQVQATLETRRLTFAILRVSQHNFHAGLSTFAGWDAYFAHKKTLSASFLHGDLQAFLALLEGIFGQEVFTYEALTQDERDLFVQEVVSVGDEELESSFLRLYERYLSSMRALRSLQRDLPDDLQDVVRVTLRWMFRRAFSRETLRWTELQGILHELALYDVRLRLKHLWHQAESCFVRALGALEAGALEPQILKSVTLFLEAFRGQLPEVSLWRLQNSYFALWNRDEQAQEHDHQELWVNEMRRLGEILGFHLGDDFVADVEVEEELLPPAPPVL